MSVKKPLVVGADGRPQQLQVADTLAGNFGALSYPLVADASLAPGAPVYPTTNDHVDNAKADAAGTSTCIGLSQAGCASSATGQVQTEGVLTLTTGQWDAVFGTTGGLTVGTTYYLSPTTAGKGTATVPTTIGQYVVILGEALSTTELLVKISEKILL